jgi:hypothetical protein
MNYHSIFYYFHRCQDVFDKFLSKPFLVYVASAHQINCLQDKGKTDRYAANYEKK